MDPVTATGPDAGTTGQAGAAPTGITDPAPASATGQATGTPIDPSGQATAPEGDASFYDHKAFETLVSSLKGNDATRALAEQAEAFIRSTRGSWTKKHQELSQLLKDNGQKIQAFDNFQRDPATSLQQIAAQMGYRLSKADAQALADSGAGSAEEWQPQTYSEIVQRAVKEAEATIMERLNPVFGKVQNLQAKAIETQLDGIDPLWRRHESRMTKLMSDHPTLVNDLATLYEMAIPGEEREAAATKKALEKLRTQTANGQVAGGEGIKRQTTPAPKAVKTFQDAVDAAREKGRSEGWYRG